MEEGFNYVNIFETKGIEYLMTIAFFAILIPFWLYLKKPMAIKEKFKQVIGILSEKILKIPLGLFYSKNHTWMQLEKSGNAKVGLDDLVMHITGEVNLSNIKQPGEKVSPGDVIAQIEQDGKQLNISSPISGEVQSVNTSINENPGIMNEDPYGKGWILKIKPEKWIAETNSCLVAEDAEEWLKKELTRFKDFVATSVDKISPEPSITILQEGGELSDNPLSRLPKEIWNDFQSEFL
ncbi:MAG: glycine cleavage system protein H [Bacteroidales bacterium]|jgi:glycine cleavage system H protein|nr:glycine cleavage system protein H [Bacteroidales bacterium]